MKRGLILSFIALALLVQFVNCSSYSDGGLTESSSLSTQGALNEISSYQGVRVLNGDTFINWDEDHAQIGGSCNTGDADQNYIETRIYKNRSPLTWGLGVEQTDHLITAKCENGRFFAIVTKPNDPELLQCGMGYVEYQVHLQMFSAKESPSFVAGERAPVFNLQIQKVPCP